MVLISYQINKLRRDSEEALKICNYCFDHGLVLIAVVGNVLRFQPPLVITYEQLDYALNTIENALQALQDGQLNNYNIDGQGTVTRKEAPISIDETGAFSFVLIFWYDVVLFFIFLRMSNTIT